MTLFSVNKRYIYILYKEMYLVLIEFHELVSQQNCQCTGGSSQRGSGPGASQCAVCLPKKI